MFINGTQPFPYRNLILFITFIVILVTLVLQGLTLPWIILKVKLGARYGTMTEQEQEVIIQKKIAKFSLQHLQEKYGEERTENKHLNNLLERLQLDVNAFEQALDKLTNGNAIKPIHHQHIYLDLLERQRKLLIDMNQHAEFDEELIRKYLGLIDMEEFKIREKLLEEMQTK